MIYPLTYKSLVMAIKKMIRKKRAVIEDKNFEKVASLDNNRWQTTAYINGTVKLLWELL